MSNLKVDYVKLGDIIDDMKKCETTIEVVYGDMKTTVEAMKKRMYVYILIICMISTGCSNLDEKESVKEDYTITNDSVVENSEINTCEGEEVLVDNEDVFQMHYIEQYIFLTSETEVESYEWVDDFCLRVKVRYIDKPEDMYQHKEDYFFFFDDEKVLVQVLHIEYDDKLLGSACGFESHFEDVTFDGNEDLLISLGYNKYEHFCAYIYEDGRYEYEKSFEVISQYKVDYDQQVVYGWVGDSATMETEYLYKYINGEFVLISKDTHNR